MSSESLYLKAESYRATAARIRRLAVRLRFSEARHELLDLASRFDLLAARAEAARETGHVQPVPSKRPDSNRAA